MARKNCKGRKLIGPGFAFARDLMMTAGASREGSRVQDKTTMKSICISAGVCFLLIAGCRKTEEKTIPAIPAVADHTSRETSQPYYDGLIEEYRRILAEDPANIAARIALGNAYSESGSWREAIRQYEHVLNLDSKNANVRTDMGTAYLNIGLPARALAEYRLALDHDPGHLNARYNMGSVYAFRLRDYAMAVQVWEELLRLAPNHPRANYIRTCIASFRKPVRKGHVQ